jgi:hypothetical protein
MRNRRCHLRPLSISRQRSHLLARLEIHRDVAMFESSSLSLSLFLFSRNRKPDRLIRSERS